MHPPRVLTAAASVLTLTAATIAVTGGAAQAATGAYVALGDSYSSGVGAGSYISDSGSCKRSDNAYPVLWNAAHDPSSFTFAACSGATTSSVASDQLGGLSAATSLVSITVGGNDVGFSTVMQNCVTQSDSGCQASVDAAEAKMDSALPGALDSLFTAIHGKAPSAHVVVLDYPHLYDLDATPCPGLSAAKHKALNGGADKLDTTIEKATSDHGFTFSDVRDDFAGHELCTGDGWLHSVAYPIDESYHPTAKGHADGYLPAFTGSA
jgi:lysophospholipase L1-like esterase